MRKSEITAANRLYSKIIAITACLCLPIAINVAMAQKTGKTITFIGNKVTFSASKMDTIMVVDPVSGKEIMKISKTKPVPMLLNGDKIYFEEGVPPQSYIEQGSLEEYVLKNVAKELSALPDGEYGLSITDIIVNEKGQIAYYNYKGVEKQDFEHFGQFVPTDSVKGIKEHIEQLLHTAPAFKPASRKGKIVVARLPDIFVKIIITVKNHQAAFYKN